MKLNIELAENEWRDIGTFTAYIMQCLVGDMQIRELSKLVAYTVILEKEVNRLRGETGMELLDGRILSTVAEMERVFAFFKKHPDVTPFMLRDIIAAGKFQEHTST